MLAPGRVFVHRSTDPSAAKFAIHHLASGSITARDEVWLADAVFEVSPGGRYRSLRERRRLVHAGVMGTLLEAPPRGVRCDCAVRYAVAEGDCFLDEEHRPIHEAALVHLVGGKVYVDRGERWL
jgi:hypothetical protein